MFISNPTAVNHGKEVTVLIAIKGYLVCSPHLFEDVNFSYLVREIMGNSLHMNHNVPHCFHHYWF